jgi:hypothetical protein
MEVPERGSVDASLGISRRTLLRRGAVVGGALVWSVPVVSTLAAPAAAAGTPAGGMSFVAVLLEKGGLWYRLKWDVEGSILTLSSGSTFNIPGGPDLLNGQTIQNGVPDGVSAQLTANGSLLVTLNGAVLNNFVVKRGQCNAGPGIAGQPPLMGQNESVTFPPPNSNQPGCAV